VLDTGKVLRRVLPEHIDIRVEAAPGATVRADAGAVEQIVFNLATNARDAMPRGGRLSVSLAPVRVGPGGAGDPASEVAPGDYICLSVADDGYGMYERTRARIFEPFFTTKPVGQGTGLGLSTVYGIVKQSDGFIWCYSEPGQGTTFKIYLPHAGQRVHDAPVLRPPVQLRGGNETILVVEDEEVVRALACRGLREQGYTVLEAKHGLEALEQVGRNDGSIDLVISDVVMPELSGRELGARLADIRPELPILYMSGYTGEDVIQRGLLDPGVPFQQKPFTPEGLARKVRELLDRQGARSTEAV
jgi:two-component system cell cycle sensor histidine kinase/response regulator CckA